MPTSTHAPEPGHSPAPTTAPPAPTTAPPTPTTSSPPAPPAPPVSLGAFPNASNTGPRGTLQPSGSVRVTTSGTVVQNLDVSGTIYIAPGVNDVTIKNVRVSGSTTLYLIDDRGTNLTIVDSQILGTGMPAPTDGINLSRGTLTLLRDDISHVRNGVNLNSAALIQDSYMHDIVQNPNSHNEDIYIGSGSHIKIIHNTLENDLAQTAAVFIKSDFGAIDDILVQNNRMAGGGYAMYGGGAGPNGAATNVRAIGNTFSRQFFPRVGHYGVRASWPNTTGSQWSGNVLDDGTVC